MNRVETMTYPLPEARARGLAATWSRVRAVLVAFAAARARETAVRDLERLSDRTLRDIGLHRSGIRAAIEAGRL